MERLIVLYLTYIIFYPGVIYGGECEKNTSRKSVQCLEEKLQTVLSKLEKQENRIKLLEDNSKIITSQQAILLNKNISEQPDLNAKHGDSNLVPRVEEKTTNPPSSPGRQIYRDDNFQVTLKSCTKNRKGIICILKYTNISDANVGIGFLGRDTYLVDDNGERWDYSKNTAIENGYGRTEILQHTHTTTKVTFNAQESTAGTKFSLFIKHNLEEGKFNITSNDIFLN